jgi:hypothetical protein
MMTFVLLFLRDRNLLAQGRALTRRALEKLPTPAQSAYQRSDSRDVNTQAHRSLYPPTEFLACEGCASFLRRQLEKQIPVRDVGKCPKELDQNGYRLS